MMKVCIAYPSFENNSYSPMWTQNRQFQWFHFPSYIFPLVPASAATLLKENGFEAFWMDCIAEGIEFSDFLRFIERERPDLVAIETKTPIMRRLWAIAGRIKEVEPRTRIVFFGDHITARPMESFLNSKIDYAVTGGDYDVSLLKLARFLRDKSELPAGIYYRDGDTIRDTGRFSLDTDLDSLPLIDRKLTKAHLYFEKWKKRDPFFYTMVGRDCMWNCKFCSWKTLYPKFRARKPESLLDEIGFLIEEYGVREIFDDTGTFPSGAWLETFCKGMIERGYNKKILFSSNFRFDLLRKSDANLMKKAGYRKVKCGLESASQKTLDMLNKNLRVEDITAGCRAASEAGIDVQLTIMVGYPWETREDAQRTCDLADNLMSKGYAEMLQSTIVIPYPGTGLYDMAVENDWFLIDPLDYDRYGMMEPILKTPDMEPAEVSEMCRAVYKRFFNARFVLRQLSRIRSWEDANYVAKGAKAVLGHILDFKR
ncbi:MAG: radical SAM protein [Candidatus Abyssobacteria bacterium SURF_5]|uniref:Radical SAM protein n=1 Tax=Abyssobacteria bacterium (strain SURF_5) TaxID=2093360 RepID=A0A3A4P4U5_ABYX5|nr:MAG: radical SAM protein [Candidatus Abyssubacteria bacterium SURF_5]